MTAQKPVYKVRAGAVTCAVWTNDITVGGKKKAVLKATVERRFKDANDEWKSSGSFSRNEIPLAVYALQQAFEYMLENPAERDDDNEVEEIVQ